MLYHQYSMYLLGRNTKVSSDYPSLIGPEECGHCSHIASRKSHSHADDDEYRRLSHHSRSSRHSAQLPSRHSSRHSSHRSQNSISQHSSQNEQGCNPNFPVFFVPPNSGAYPATGCQINNQYPYPAYPAPGRPPSQMGPPMQYVLAPPGAYPNNEQQSDAPQMAQQWAQQWAELQQSENGTQ